MGLLIIPTNEQHSPTVNAIMAECRCSRQEAFYALFALKAYVHDNARHGRFYADARQIDFRAGIPGFTAALARLGFILMQGPEGCEMHTTWRLRKGQPKKRKAKVAK